MIHIIKMNTHFDKIPFIINILFHVFILFVFLTFLFFHTVTKTEDALVQNQFEVVIKNSADRLIEDIDDSTKINDQLNWEELKEFADTQLRDTTEPDPDVQKHNKEVKMISYIMIGTMFMVLVGSIIYFKYIKHIDNLDITHLIIENLGTFMVVGGLEYLFFTQIISNYIPTYPDSATVELIKELQTYF